MAIFEPGKPIITKEPFVTVDNKLEPGTYRFRLIIQRADGTESQPVFQDVLILPEGSLRTLSAAALVLPTATADVIPETRPARKRARRGQGKRSNPNPEP